MEDVENAHDDDDDDQSCSDEDFEQEFFVDGRWV